MFEDSKMILLAFSRLVGYVDRSLEEYCMNLVTLSRRDATKWASIAPASYKWSYGVPYNVGLLNGLWVTKIISSFSSLQVES